MLRDLLDILFARRIKSRSVGFEEGNLTISLIERQERRSVFMKFVAPGTRQFFILDAASFRDPPEEVARSSPVTRQ